MLSHDMRANPASTGRGATAADLVTISDRSCSPFSTVLEATVVFRDEDCGTLPVVDTGKLLGVVTDRDVALGVPVYPDLADRPVSDVMSRDVCEVRPDDSLDEIERRFASAKVRHLVVIGSDGRMVGVIAWADLIKHLHEGRLSGVLA
jgi:predicted transcriptional regulator